MEKVFARSASLDGDAVVIFVRALCAVSQEELVPVRPGEAPRCCDDQGPGLDTLLYLVVAFVIYSAWTSMLFHPQ